MNKFLLDANLSPETSVYLRENFDFDVMDLITENKYDIGDEEVIELAKKEKRTIITFDLDFGEIYHQREKGKVGIIILRLENQTIESVNKVLFKFFSSEVHDIDLQTSLVIIERRGVRIYSQQAEV